jgi:predicted dehydrogenase
MAMNPVESPIDSYSSTAVADVSRTRGAQGRQTVRIGIVGCGSFARFSAEQYRRLPGAAIACVADANPDAARRAAGLLDAAVVDPDSLLGSPDVDLVYIATPPEAHFRQARAALRAGKHVLVEKPLATTLADAQELEAVAAREGLVCVANLVERYNPLAESIRRLIESRILGDLVHGVFLNEAADEGLSPEHWFWNREKSGGIFVEHGVHFFDLASFWLGPGRVVAAARGVRPPLRRECGDGGGAEGLPEVVAPVEEQVSCTCRYAADGWTARAHPLVPEGVRHEPHSGVLFHFEHGFHQPSRLDRQEMRLVFERGEVRLYEWVLSHGFLRAIVDDAGLESLAGMLPASVTRVVERFEAGGRRLKGRFRGFNATQIVEMSFTTGLDKSSLYGQMVHDLAADQLARVRNPFHVRRLTEADSVAAVAMACEADRIALEAG